MRKYFVSLLMVAALSGCASKMFSRPVVTLGMTEAAMLEQMGPAHEIVSREGGVKVFYWAQLDTYTGRIHAEAYVTRDGKVVNEPSLVADRVADGDRRYWD